MSNLQPITCVYNKIYNKLKQTYTNYNFFFFFFFVLSEKNKEKDAKVAQYEWRQLATTNNLVR